VAPKKKGKAEGFALGEMDPREQRVSIGKDPLGGKIKPNHFSHLLLKSLLEGNGIRFEEGLFYRPQKQKQKGDRVKRLDAKDRNLETHKTYWGGIIEKRWGGGEISTINSFIV